MLKKSIFFIITFLVIVLTVVQAQTQAQQQELEQIARRSVNGLSAQDRQRVIQIMTDVYVSQGMSRQQAAPLAEMAANSMFTSDVGEMTPEQRRQFEEQEQRLAEYNRQEQQRQAEAARQQQQQPSQTTSNPSQLVTSTGRAWVIQDNQVQGSGKAIVFKADGGVESYERRFGVWSPHREYVYATTTFTATRSGISIRFNREQNPYQRDYTYTISGNGSTLTINGDQPTAGTYTLRDAPRIQPPGGNIVNPAGTGWEDTSGSHDIYHTDGRQYSFGGAGYRPWDFGQDGNWYTYTANSSTGRLTRIYKGRDNFRPEELSYSVTDFGGGNKTLRMWRVSNTNPHDEVYKLVPTPSGFQLPRVR